MVSRLPGDEFWRSVSLALKGRRLARGMSAVEVEHAGGPSRRTLRDIERGEIGNVRSLTLYAAALGISVAELLAPLVPRHADSAEAAELVRIFDSELRDNDEARAALLLMGRALALQNNAARRSGRKR